MMLLKGLARQKMQRHLLLIFIIILGLSACATNNAEKPKVLNYTQSNTDYYAIVDRIKANTASSDDFDRLIKIYPLTSLYDPTSDKEQSAKLLSQSYMQSQNWRQCWKVNQGLLMVNYSSLTGHYGAAICASELGNDALGRFHTAVLDSLIEAIWRTGNGQSVETPFYITSTNDLYAFIQLHQLVAVGQSIRYINRLPVQAIEVQNPETMRVKTWYFDVTPQFRRGVIDELER